MNQRVQIFVPSEECLDLLEEIVKLDNKIMKNIIIETNDENKSYGFQINKKDNKINIEKKSEDISSISDSINGNKNIIVINILFSLCKRIFY